ncbi:MAG TPA: CaiB/BaiF CoA-transferase family protein [Intrasporangium sp.]|uniref:CaiB/BaiF CoA transferase family protein n=1 Tax=Intrasporangium sp. TaxID=1925024 RepID=UPI002D78ED1F|nr:CaiB/BaiF CoA-transferase family protein [Intrasporangium sp.]HET7399881.1 CaiB/BaiF CoA-transferase family protein [Intrasporangium sp.]
MSGNDRSLTLTGPLAGLKVVEVGSIGPGPFCAMLLADLGADIIRVDRLSGAALVGPSENFRTELLNRGRRSIAVDLKHPDGAEIVLSLVERADVIMEGFRPGVAERLGIGPDDCAGRNPGIIYGRMTGYGQDGPLAQTVGHDINYVALSGLLSMIGRKGQPPTPPLALAGDFGGGGMILALGILAALLERTRSGQGQVVDAAMVHGAALLGTCFYGYAQTGEWHPERGTNIVDSGAPFYDAYETADGRWLAVGAMEPHFYADLVELLELPEDLPDQNDQGAWPLLKETFAQAVRRRTLDEWLRRGEGRSPCISPVLDALEAPKHPHHVARGTFIEVDGLVQPAPAPRFSRTPATVDRRPPVPGEHTTQALASWGVDAGLVTRWLEAGAAADRADGS